MSELTSQECEFIDNHIGEMSPSRIAKELKKPAYLIQRYLKAERPNATLNKSVDSGLRSRTEFWDLLQEQFLPPELDYFEDRYNKMMDQFSKDVLPTEEAQIFQAIEIEIFMNRNKKQRKTAIESIELLRELILEEKDQEKPNTSKIDNWMKQIDSLNSMSSASSKEYNDLSGKHAALIRDLKSTRDQRVKQQFDSKTNFLGFIKELERKEVREKHAREMELMKAALQREQERLSKLHTFKDQSVDIPLLNHESISKVQT